MKCIRCKLDKDKREFYKSKDNKSGSLHICNLCMHLMLTKFCKGNFKNKCVCKWIK